MGKFLIPTLFFLTLLVPAAAHAQVINNLNPLIPEACRCNNEVDPASGESIRSAPDYKCVLQVVQNVVNLTINVGFVLFIFALSYAGFLIVTSLDNPARRNQAKKLTLSVFVGVAIMLTSWLIVDFVMKTFAGDNTGGFGPWNSILADSSGQHCLVAEDPQALTTGSLDLIEHAADAEANNAPAGNGAGGNCPAAPRSGMVAFPREATNGETEYALPQTVQNFLAMREVAGRAGIDLKINDGHREESEQIQLWNSRGNKVVAKPCTLRGGGSNHNSGEAIDIHVGCANGNPNCNTPIYRWLKENGGRWHFINNVPRDPVHWSPSGR